MLVSYNWLQEYFKDPLPKPDKLADILNTRAFEVEGVSKVGDDYTIDIDVLPNRAHDCLSHIGIAREIQTLTGLKRKEITFHKSISNITSDLDIKIESEDCNRYIGCRIENVVVDVSPNELKKKLEVLGQRSINTIVDITNIVMYDIGQPMHAFDADKIFGSITIRKAKEGEKMTTLDGKDVELKSEYTVIADDEKVLAIAGVKGGNSAEVDENTTNIILESANFNHSAVRKTSKSTNISTDSSKRFEHEISAELAKQGMVDAIHFIRKYASNNATGYGDIIDVYPNPVEIRNVKVSLHEIDSLLGASISENEVSKILERLGFNFSVENDIFEVTPPKERLDIVIKEDLIEEIGRVYGYENILEKPINSIDRVAKINPIIVVSDLIRNALINNGFSEIMTSSFVKEADVRVLKSFAEDRTYLRNTLVDGMRVAMEMNLYNADLLGLQQVRTFEIGKRFTEKGEELMLCLGVGNNKIKKPVVSEVLRMAIAEMEKEIGSSFGIDVSDDDSVIEISLEKIINELPEGKKYSVYSVSPKNEKYKSFSSYPYMLRDIAVWIPGSVGQDEMLMDIIKKEVGELLVNITLFDVYEKVDEKKTSFAFRLVFQSMEKTLSDDEVNPVMDKITSVLGAMEGFEVR